MRDLLTKLLEQSHFNTGIKVTPFSVWHLIYLALIFGALAFLYVRLHDASQEKKEKAMRGLVYALMFSYLSDFFVQQFVYGGMTEEKLPFHICIVTAVLMPVAQFNRKGGKILEPVVILATLSPMMYLGFPASVGEGEPWCYQTVQVMFFHGVQLIWGLLNLMLGIVQPRFRHIWKSAALLAGITLWAKLGNMMYDRNFFFLEEDALFIGLVAKEIIPAWVLMIVNPMVYFAAIALLYGLCYALRADRKEKRIALAYKKRLS